MKTSNATKVDELFDKLIKYSLVIVPLITGIVGLLTYLQVKFFYIRLGIHITPVIDRFRVFTTSFAIISFLLFISMPVIILALRLHFKQVHSPRLLIIVSIGVFVAAFFLSSGFGVVGRVVNSITILIPFFVLFLITFTYVAGIDFVQIMDENLITRYFKGIGIAVILTFCFIFQIVGRPIAQLNSTAIYHNVASVEGFSYLVVARDGDNYLLSKLCNNGYVEIGNFRFIEITKIQETKEKKFALKPQTCE